MKVLILLLIAGECGKVLYRIVVMLTIWYHGIQNMILL
jgi:hypothetical protein